MNQYEFKTALTTQSVTLDLQYYKSSTQLRSQGLSIQHSTHIGLLNTGLVHHIVCNETSIYTTMSWHLSQGKHSNWYTKYFSSSAQNILTRDIQV